MIKAKFKRDENGLTMTVRGHARSAEKGQDLVCAAASILAYTAAQDVTDAYRNGMLKGEPKVAFSEGKAEIDVSPKDEHFAEVLHTLFVVQKGLLLLAANNPTFVKVTPFTC